jgi:hypothetical protein
MSSGYRDPTTHIWGSHVHIESHNDYVLSIGTHESFMSYLRSKGVHIKSHGSFHPGYGPHRNTINNDIRLEHYQTQTTKERNDFITPDHHFYEIITSAIYGSLNRNELSVAIHMNTFNDFIFDLGTEWIDHVHYTISLNEDGLAPDWDVKFFSDPVMLEIREDDPVAMELVGKGLPCKDGKVLTDTRAPFQMKEDERNRYLESYKEKPRSFLTPERLVSMKVVVANGDALFEGLNLYLNERGIQYDSVKDGIAFNLWEDQDTMEFETNCGVALAWVILNRGELSGRVFFDVNIRDVEAPTTLIASLVTLPY